MDILRSRNLLAGAALAVTAMLGLTACGEQQLEIYGDMGIIEVQDNNQAVAIECVEEKDHPDDEFIITFNGPGVALVKKSPDSARYRYGDTITLSQTDGTLQSFLKNFNTDNPGAYRGVSEQLVNDTTDQQVTAPCQEKLGDAVNKLPPSFNGNLAFLRRSHDMRTLNKISLVTGPVDGNNLILPDRYLAQHDGTPLIDIQVNYK